MYVYNTILCIILPAHQITNTIVYANARVSNAASMGGKVNLTSFAAVISLSQLFYFIESHENTIVEFVFCYLNKMGMQKIYL